eukprot:11226649-Lingulodinium_polyedra.AAC.1
MPGCVWTASAGARRRPRRGRIPSAAPGVSAPRSWRTTRTCGAAAPMQSPRRGRPCGRPPPRA